MADRLALVIGVEAPTDSTISPAPFAESDATAFARVLDRLGFRQENQTILLGTQATKTAIESRLRKLAKNPASSQELFVFYAGPSFHVDGNDYLACHDSEADDLAQTSISVNSLLHALTSKDRERIVLFLDARGGIATDSLVEQLKAFPSAASFVACEAREKSSFSGALKAGIWAHHVIEALSGKAPLALEGGRFLTASLLQEHLAREIPRTLRATFREAPVQTPDLILPSASRFLIADVDVFLSEADPTSDPRLAPSSEACCEMKPR